jgi:hypothetical protein
MTTHHDDIELTIGDEWLIVGKLLDEDGEPLDLDTGVELSWTLLAPDGNQVPGLDATLDKQSGGVVRIVVPDSFTRTLRPARYMDAIRAWTGGEPATQWTGIVLANADPFHPTIEITPPLLLPPEVPMIEEAPDDGQLYVRRSGQWVELPSGFSTRFEYTFDSSVDAPPNNSQLRLDNVDAALATKIWVHNNDADGVDVSNLLTLVEKDFILFVQDKNDPTKRARYIAEGPMTNLGTYCEIPVAYATGLGVLTDNQRVIVMVYGGG